MSKNLKSGMLAAARVSRYALMLGLSGSYFVADAALAAEATLDEASFEEIIVSASRARTATKTDTSLMEIPQSISVVSSEQIAEIGAVNFQDVFRYSAGIATETGGVDVRLDRMVARGFPTADYLDGLNRRPDGLYGVRLEVFTLERADVLRGPSAVLYGAGGPGGLFNGVSKKPQYDFGGQVGVQVGTDDRVQGQIDVTGGLSQNVTARFVGVWRDAELQSDGQVDDRILAMPSITWSPTPDTDMTFILLYQKDDMGTQTHLPLSKTLHADSDAEKLDINFFAGEPDFNHMKTEHIAGTFILDHRFSDMISYSGRVRYYHQTVDYAEVYGDYFDGFGISPFMDAGETLLRREFYVLDESYNNLNTDHNLKFEFETGDFSHQVLLGLDYTYFKQDRQEGFSCAGYPFAPCFEGSNPPALDITNPVYGADFDYGFTNAYKTKSTQRGIYLQDQIKYKDFATLVLGARRDHSTSETDSVEEDANNATTFRAGLTVDVGGGFSPYVGYSESFLPVFGGDFYGNPYKPRTGRQYEAGVKWQPAFGTMVTVSLFDIKESNFLTTDPANIQNFIQSGEQGSKGVEVEGQARLLDSVTLNAAYSYTKAEILSDTTGREGFRVEKLPEHLASFRATKDIQVNDELFVRFGAGVRYVGSKIDYYNILETPSVTLVDSFVEANYRQWSMSINASNLFNKEFYAICEAYSSPYGYCTAGMDRRILATVSRRF